MREIRFDFNNMFDFSIGSEHGVEEKDISVLSDVIHQAHKHLAALISHESNRVALGLEWTRLPFQDEGLINQIQRLGREIANKYQDILFLGIGGSYLGLKAAQDALCGHYYNDFAAVRKKKPRIYFEGNNLDPDTMNILLNNLSPKNTFVVVISKSGETTETKAAFSLVEKWLKKGVGKNYARQVFAITDPDSGALRRRVNLEQQKDKLSFCNLPFLKGVGGRFSEFNMGLLHLAIMGVDIKEVFSGAKAMYERCIKPDVFKNPAYMYATVHHILSQNKAKPIALLMPFSERLKSVADWYCQLLAESLGKKFLRKIDVLQGSTEQWPADISNIVNTGRTPVSSRGTTDLHSIQQNNVEGKNDKVITFIKVEKFKSNLKISGKGDILSGKSLCELMSLAEEGTEWALVRAKRPNCTIIMPEVSAYHWGGLLFFFEMATAFEGELLNVNAFDQPGVESYKNYMYYKLNKPGIPDSVASEIKNNPLIKKPEFIL